mmetsp:Transcript_16530/g.22786  ORF Transcript_16530/g.22786 Transcript_16530/m.22786 type:complete len:87 (+) Transcript_16530:18-278(+)|eukprot:CAMPEP_0176378004 /NCGR_PEP_ID=MMETSP0126-20121128/29308_1 /TAXON_ID=141414 ORGANISM="Strombidinopsis acuminatum, Strain SPMC142" /NCGR_SAMPLE_ID=MMETSP0126 /ASSEMBLY_ACC=CAM_ASM_000229 /LENGTH=86 /DNA_ID=CAMNT_0017740115 /DNA_START=46 /DNA_END=306 /DNA_ORIENTATION=-
MYKTTLSVLSLIAVAAAYESTEDYCKVIYEGEIRSVYEPSKCLDIANADGKGGMGTYHCDGLDDQYFYHCDDGTIRNKRNNYCVTP